MRLRRFQVTDQYKAIRLLDLLSDLNQRFPKGQFGVVQVGAKDFEFTVDKIDDTELLTKIREFMDGYLTAITRD